MKWQLIWPRSDRNHSTIHLPPFRAHRFAAFEDQPGQDLAELTRYLRIECAEKRLLFELFVRGFLDDSFDFFDIHNLPERLVLIAPFASAAASFRVRRRHAFPPIVRFWREACEIPSLDRSRERQSPRLVEQCIDATVCVDGRFDAIFPTAAR